MASPDDLISISKASERTDLPESTIRYYDREFADFLSIQRGSNNERLFTDQNLEDLEYIRYLIKRENLSVEEVKDRLSREIEYQNREEDDTDSKQTEESTSEADPSDPNRTPESPRIDFKQLRDELVKSLDVINENMIDKTDDLQESLTILEERIDTIQENQEEIRELLDLNLQRYNQIVKNL